MMNGLVKDPDGQPCRNGGNRVMTFEGDALDMGLVCWERCIPCNEVYMTLVDMQYETVSENGVHVAELSRLGSKFINDVIRDRTVDQFIIFKRVENQVLRLNTNL